jgi:hypothetical protein
MLVQFRSCSFRLCQFMSGKIMMCHVRLSQVWPGEERLIQGCSGYVRSGQVMKCYPDYMILF